MINKILGISIPNYSKKEILEKIIKYLKKPTGFFHIVSLNPENLVIANKNQQFKKIILSSQMTIIDGVGIVLASRLLGFQAGERFAGVDLMKKIIEIANKLRLRVLLIGSKGKLAESLADCYNRQYFQARFFGIEGVKDVNRGMTKQEKAILNKIVTDFKPQIVFVAFGSPHQEIWIEHQKNLFKNCLVMGVGGGFDFLAGKIRRAPIFLRKIGLEWLFRLFNQPWRWKRQLRLIEFVWLVMRENIVRIKDKKH